MRVLPTITTVLFTVLVITNVYWWRRVRRTERARDVSRRWDEGEFRRTTDSDTEWCEQLAELAADLNVSPTDVRAEVKRMDERIRTLEGTVSSVRERMIESWWDSISTNHDCIVVRLSRGTVDEATAMAKRAQRDYGGVAIVIAEDDGSFAVSSGGRSQGEVDAVSVADEISEKCDARSGGSSEIATGGGADPAELVEATRDVAERIDESANVR